MAKRTCLLSNRMVYQLATHFYRECEKNLALFDKRSHSLYSTIKWLLFVTVILDEWIQSVFNWNKLIHVTQIQSWIPCWIVKFFKLESTIADDATWKRSRAFAFFNTKRDFDRRAVLTHQFSVLCESIQSYMISLMILVSIWLATNGELFFLLFPPIFCLFHK